MLGRIEFDNFKSLETMPQEAASAWSATENIIGAGYKPLLYIGKQIVHGTNYFFFAEQTMTDKEFSRHVVLIEITSFGGVYTISDIRPIIL